MIDKIKSLGKQTMVYGLGSILNKVLGFILIPVYQSHIHIKDFGYLVYFETIILFLSALLNYGIASGHQRFFYLEKENKTYGVFLFNNFLGCIFLAIFSILPMLFFSKTLASTLVGEENQSLNLQITLWIVVIELLYVIPLQILQYEKKPFQFLFYNALKLALTYAITIYLVAYLQKGFTGFLIARLLGGGITMVATVFFVTIPRCTLKLAWEPFIKSVKFGFPHIISTLGYTLFMITDRIMLKWLSTPEELGKYGFGFRIANFVNLIFVQTIGMSYFPSVMNNENKEDNIRYYRKMLSYYCFVIGFLILGFLLFYKDILWIVGKDQNYWQGLVVVPVLSLSFMIMGMAYFVQIGLFLKNKTKYYLIPSITAVAINILLNINLIPLFGMMGAAFSVLAAQIIYISVLSYISGKFMKVNFEWFKILQTYVIAIILYLVYAYWIMPNFLIELGLKTLLIILYPFILYFFGFFEKVEIQNIKKGAYKVLAGFKSGN